MCLDQGANLHMAQLMPLPLTVSCSSKSGLVLPFWYRLTRVVLDKVKGAVKRFQQQSGIVCFHFQISKKMLFMYHTYFVKLQSSAKTYLCITSIHARVENAINSQRSLIEIDMVCKTVKQLKHCLYAVPKSKVGLPVLETTFANMCSL